MNKGTLVKCINENFPCVISRNKKDIGTFSNFQPWLGGIFEVDDVLGKFITIEMFNDPLNIKWWLSSHFRKLTGDEVIEHYKQVNKYKPMAKRILKMAKDKLKELKYTP
ncbi:MAG TPA: hypothetical protein PKD51_11545 [Saprospiraceae bacterium]|nr:hypothetical protein [Saprospiraceae bacterium]HMU03840.1 hypothetical protein [Saprospiraceae bacterium]